MNVLTKENADRLMKPKSIYRVVGRNKWTVAQQCEDCKSVVEDCAYEVCPECGTFVSKYEVVSDEITWKMRSIKVVARPYYYRSHYSGVLSGNPIGWEIK